MLRARRLVLPWGGTNQSLRHDPSLLMLAFGIESLRCPCCSSTSCCCSSACCSAGSPSSSGTGSPGSRCARCASRPPGSTAPPAALGLVLCCAGTSQLHFNPVSCSAPRTCSLVNVPLVTARRRPAHTLSSHPAASGHRCLLSAVLDVPLRLYLSPTSQSLFLHVPALLCIFWNVKPAS